MEEIDLDETASTMASAKVPTRESSSSRG